MTEVIRLRKRELAVAALAPIERFNSFDRPRFYDLDPYCP